MVKIFVVSDATAETAVRVVRAALVQFENAQVTLVRCTNTRTPEQIRAVVEEAETEGSVVLHTLVSDKLRQLMLSEARLRNVDSLDMLGPILERLAKHLGLTPQEKPGLFKQLSEARTREVEAVEYAFHHDDGQNVDDLDRAEVVLVGVSRTMKTPTMLYLSYRGWFSANVPLIPDLELPATLTDLPSKRVFCLVMAPEQLVELRRVRAEKQGIPVEAYASAQQVHKELQYATELSRKHGWRRIDVTTKSVEEVCREIIALLPSREAR